MVVSAGGSRVPTSSDVPVLAAHRLKKAFGGVRAVRGVSFELHAGEIVALLGDNGAGKSTTLKMLAGVLQPDAGQIVFGGKEVKLRSARDAQRLGIETVYQDLALADPLDVTQNIFAGRELHRLGFVRRGEMERLARALFEELQVRIPKVAAPVRALSGGQRQGTAIARAVRWGSNTLLLDEPTAALGVRERSHVLDVVLSLRSKGIATLLITHSLPDAFEVADRFVILRHGRVVMKAPSAGVTQKEVVSLMMGGDAEASTGSE